MYLCAPITEKVGSDRDYALCTPKGEVPADAGPSTRDSFIPFRKTRGVTLGGAVGLELI